MRTKKIVITGGPGTGKSAVIESLQSKGRTCFPEISREIILEAKEKGTSQLFLEDPLLFSNLLLEGRIMQYENAEKIKESCVFLDRGIPDVVAYLDYIESMHPPVFNRSCRTHAYDAVFLFPPWKAIYENDNERYETFEQAQQIHEYLIKTYRNFGYELIEVPKTAVEERASFILNKTENL